MSLLASVIIAAAIGSVHCAQAEMTNTTFGFVAEACNVSALLAKPAPGMLLHTAASVDSLITLGHADSISSVQWLLEYLQTPLILVIPRSKAATDAVATPTSPLLLYASHVWAVPGGCATPVVFVLAVLAGIYVSAKRVRTMSGLNHVLNTLYIIVGLTAVLDASFCCMGCCREPTLFHSETCSGMWVS